MGSRSLGETYFSPPKPEIGSLYNRKWMHKDSSHFLEIFFEIRIETPVLRCYQVGRESDLGIRRNASGVGAIDGHDGVEEVELREGGVAVVIERT